MKVSIAVANTITKTAWKGKDLFQHTVLHPSPSSEGVRVETEAGQEPGGQS